MPGDIAGVAFWPGALSIESCQGTISHGLTPAVFLVKISPQPNPPAQFGDLLISDGYGSAPVPDCRWNMVKTDRDDNGLYHTLEIVDRRWKFRDLGLIEGWYNQLDSFGNLIPWTVRSPTELAALCLTKMGESGYAIDMPAGLASPGLAVDFFLKASGVNPPINWDGIPPAQALQQLCDQFNRRIVYRLSSNTLAVVPVGVGADLPVNGMSINKIGPSLKSREIPDGIGVRGAPIRYQMRLLLEPVGEEWDGTFRPINDLSYAPVIIGAVQISTATVTCTGSSSVTFKVSINGVEFDYPVSGGNSAAFVVTQLAMAISASTDPRVRGVVVASDGSNVLTVRGVAPGVAFTFSTSKSDIAGSTPLDQIVAAQTQVPTQAGGEPWALAFPPDFAADPLARFDAPSNTTGRPVYGVHATSRLTWPEAQALAQKTVWKYYRVSNVDASMSNAVVAVAGSILGTARPIRVPGYGNLAFREQLILQDSQVDQAVPAPNDPNLRDSAGRSITVNFYNGLSKDKPAAVFTSTGIVKYSNGDVWFQNAALGANTPPNSQVFTPFTIDPVFFLVKFTDHVYFWDRSPGRARPPVLLLQTAVLVRNAQTNQIEHFTKIIPLTDSPVGTAPKITQHDDVQVNVTSTYDNNANITSVGLLEADPLARADYYLQGMALQYDLGAGQTIDYNGIVPIDLDGAIQQVTYSIGGGDFAYTVASRNSEHDYFVASYQARQRALYLPPIPEGRGPTDGPRREGF